MRRSCLVFLIVLHLFLGPSILPAQSGQGDALEELYIHPLEAGRQDFLFTVEQTIDARNPYIRIFRLDVPDLSENIKYTLRYFLEGQIKDVFRQISLPYTFKRNFSGLRPGEYTVVFELRDEENRISSWTVIICVD